MVRLANNALKGVVFFGTPSEDGGTAYRGTGFLVRYKRGGIWFPYLVTCRHVASKLDAGFFIRANLSGGGASEVSIDGVRWLYHPDKEVDLAIAQFPLEKGVYDALYFSYEHILTKEKLETKNIGAGDLINIVGLFRLHAGDKRNLAITHTGHIALVPVEGETIPVRDRVTQKVINVEGYLVEAQTLEGLSGSPVYVRRTISSLPAGDDPTGVMPKAYGSVWLLGVYQGAWDAAPGEVLEKDRRLERNAGVRVPVGMGIVVPAWKLGDMFDLDEIRAEQDAMIADQKASNAATADFANPRLKPAPPGADENPRHKEDFMRLLGEATRGKPPADKT